MSFAARGFDLTFRDIRSTDVRPHELLTKYEQKQFDNLFVFAPSAKCEPEVLHVVVAQLC